MKKMGDYYINGDGSVKVTSWGGEPTDEILISKEQLKTIFEASYKGVSEAISEINHFLNMHKSLTKDSLKNRINANEIYYKALGFRGILQCLKKDFRVDTSINLLDELLDKFRD